MVIGSCSDIDDALLNSLPEAVARAAAEPIVRLPERPTAKRGIARHQRARRRAVTAADGQRRPWSAPLELTGAAVE